VAFLRESPIRGRRLRVDEALMERVLMSPVGYQYLLHVAPRIDKMLIPRTNGRLSSAGTNVVGLVTTTGAKSGQPRTQPLTLIDDSDGLLAIGSNYGRAKHPAWSTNLLAHPECTVEFRGPPASCAPREIRVFRLRPLAA
jgi:deazaflavin-dependent oxidoreductase (nitroreductase family)